VGVEKNKNSSCACQGRGCHEVVLKEELSVDGANSKLS